MTMAKIDLNDIKPEELARLRTTFALRRLSTDVQNAVLSDGTIAARVLKNHTLTIQARTLFESLIEKTDYSHDDFFAACNILAAAPEPFADALRETARKGELAMFDFLPKDSAHWENITARHAGS